ncbi:MAG: PH domain-containing protein [Oceanospirillaceae bacterium]|nr:PH domain-containing protein [Oceanospirillaceae bacterium]
MPTYTANPVMFRNRPFSFILSILLIPAGGIGILILLYWYLSCKATSLTVSEGQIYLEEGLLSKSRAEIDCDSVRTVKVYQSFINRIFGVGSIEIYTAGDQPEMLVKGLPDPNEIRDVIKGNKDGV